MEIHTEQVLLFGSQSTGSAREGSDFDLIVISDDWKNLYRRERLELLGVAAARILEPIQAQGLHLLKSLRGKSIPFGDTS